MRAHCHSSTKAEIERKGYKKGGRAVVISLLVQAGDERVTLVTYRFKYLLRHLLNDDLQHHEFHLHIRHLRIARRWQYVDDDRAVSGQRVQLIRAAAGISRR
jgi:hypothetical protein